MASITASSSSKDEAYALCSGGVWAPAKQQPAPVSVCECVCVCISVCLLNKLFLIDDEEYRLMRRSLFQQPPNFQPLTLTCTDHHHYYACVFSHNAYSELTFSFDFSCCIL